MRAFRIDLPEDHEAFMAKTYLELATCVVVVSAAVLVAITRCTNCTLPLLPR